MTKAIKPTFKNEPRLTGLSAVGNRPGAEIKVNGKRVGTILGASFSVANFEHRVQIAVKDDAERIGWRWIMPRATFKTRDDAKVWLRENFAKVIGDRELHCFED
jgi:hypothetical protein